VKEDADAIGQQLRAARERMGLGVAQAAEQMHVDEKVIDALETGRFNALGAPVYVRGHLRHYADLVGEPSASGRYESLNQMQSICPVRIMSIPLPGTSSVLAEEKAEFGQK
jgi:cytoskeleton protein RodZ